MLYENVKNEANVNIIRKSEYRSPRLVNYGTVRNLTKSNNASGAEGLNPQGKCAGQGKCVSERRVKENIIRIGTHPLGIGLYLFDYKPEYREKWGYGQQFGVMVDEVEKVMPEAVSVHPDGYKMVDYGMLGISRALH